MRKKNKLSTHINLLLETYIQIEREKKREKKDESVNTTEQIL